MQQIKTNGHNFPHGQGLETNISLSLVSFPFFYQCLLFYCSCVSQRKIDLRISFTLPFALTKSVLRSINNFHQNERRVNVTQISFFIASVLVKIEFQSSDKIQFIVKRILCTQSALLCTFSMICVSNYAGVCLFSNSCLVWVVSWLAYRIHEIEGFG